MQTAIGLPTDHYKRVVQMIGTNRRIGTRITGRDGIPARFYFKDNQMMCDQHDKDGNKITQEVFDVANVPIRDEFKDAMIARIKKDFPDKPDDVIEAEADILTVANDVIKGLMVKAGLPGEQALNLVKSVLNQDLYTPEEVKKLLLA